ncbi:hypothetical protein TNCV_4072491 [Trichonephila clavipes]|uniref:Uncharacterized protein n=1 Tax=Trichonephila clavipes TaxID=2585209 RepID=A0A8X6W988_TRICX|nr:hypothetical protein TNCV_4072491 [Trichonephila clavipes]
MPIDRSSAACGITIKMNIGKLSGCNPRLICLLNLSAMGLDVLLIDDKKWAHRAHVVNQYMEREALLRMK